MSSEFKYKTGGGRSDKGGSGEVFIGNSAPEGGLGTNNSAFKSRGSTDPDAFSSLSSPDNPPVRERRSSQAVKKKADGVKTADSLEREQKEMVSLLWSAVLPKMTVLVVSSDLIFTTLISQVLHTQPSLLLLQIPSLLFRPRSKMPI